MIKIPSQLVFGFTDKCNVPTEAAANTNFQVFAFTRHFWLDRNGMSMEFINFHCKPKVYMHQLVHWKIGTSNRKRKVVF